MFQLASLNVMTRRSVTPRRPQDSSKEITRRGLRKALGMQVVWRSEQSSTDAMIASALECGSCPRLIKCSHAEGRRRDDMWVFTRYGFYSIACASKSDGSLDKQSVMVRARCIAHLQGLQKRFPALAVGEIRKLPNHDYRYRLIIPKASWIAIIGELAQEQ